MNKEQFRKELEDCWDASDLFLMNEYIMNPGKKYPDKSTYITTRLAALKQSHDLSKVANVSGVQGQNKATEKPLDDVDVEVGNIKNESLRKLLEDAVKFGRDYVTKNTGTNKMIGAVINSETGVWITSKLSKRSDGVVTSSGISNEIIVPEELKCISCGGYSKNWNVCDNCWDEVPKDQKKQRFSNDKENQK